MPILKSLKTSYAASVYSATSEHSRASRQSGKSIKEQAVEVAAELAAKQVHLQSLGMQERESARLAELEAYRSRQNLQKNSPGTCLASRAEITADE